MPLENEEWYRNVKIKLSIPLLFMFGKKKSAYIKHWIKLIIISEAALLIFNHNLTIGYLVIAVLFFIGFLLRILKMYPGGEEPLALDISACLISALFIGIVHLLNGSNWRFLVILLSSLIVLPHFIYIIQMGSKLEMRGES